MLQKSGGSSWAISWNLSQPNSVRSGAQVSEGWPLACVRVRFIDAGPRRQLWWRRHSPRALVLQAACNWVLAHSRPLKIKRSDGIGYHPRITDA